MIILCFDITYIGFGGKGWMSLALRGEKLAAIKALREIKNKKHPDVNDPRRMGLKKAKDTVEAYMRKFGVGD